MKGNDRIGMSTEKASHLDHMEFMVLASIIHSCCKITQEILSGNNTEAWNEDTGVFIVNDPERPEKKIRVYFNALNETMVDADNKAENKGVFQASMDLMEQVSEMKGEPYTEIKRVCSIWICRDQNAPNSINGTISRYRLDDIKLTESSESSAGEKGNILIYVIRLWNFDPDAVCQNVKDELLVTLRQFYDLLI